MSNEQVEEIIKSGVDNWYQYIPRRRALIPEVVHTIKDGLGERYSPLMHGLGRFVALLLYREVPEFFCEGHKDKPVEAQEDHYPYIRLSYDLFFDLLKQPFLKKGGEFIDVGCGIGDKVALANLVFGYNATGIEYTPLTYYTGVCYLTGRNGYFHDSWGRATAVHLVLGDAFDHNYKPYDVIYLYHPIRNSHKMRELYLHIFKTMKRNAVLIEALPGLVGGVAGDFNGTGPIRDNSWSGESYFWQKVWTRGGFMIKPMRREL